MGHYKVGGCQLPAASQITPGLIRITDMSSAGDVNDNSVAVSPRGAIRLLRAIVDDELRDLLRCRLMRSAFDGASWDSANQRFIMACPEDKVRLNVQTGVLELDVDTDDITLQGSLLTMVDTMEEAYQYEVPELTVTN